MKVDLATVAYLSQIFCSFYYRTFRKAVRLQPTHHADCLSIKRCGQPALKQEAWCPCSSQLRPCCLCQRWQPCTEEAGCCAPRAGPVGGEVSIHHCAAGLEA